MAKKNLTLFAVGKLILGLPERTPFHLIVSFALIALTSLNAIHLKENLDPNRFAVVAIFLGLVVLVSIWLITRSHPPEGPAYSKGLRFARTLGLISACVAFVICWPVLKTGGDYFTWQIIAVVFQGIVFAFYLFVSSAPDAAIAPAGLDLSGNAPTPARYVDSSIALPRRVNNQQLCIVTSTLLLGLCINTNIPAGHTATAGDIEPATLTIWIFRLLWAVCMVVWVTQLLRVVNIQGRVDTE